jgi:hypothetical protein
MVASPKGLGPDDDCAGEGQQQLQTTDASSRQRERPTSTNPQLSASNQDLPQAPDWCFIQRQTGRLTVGRNITLTLTLTLTMRQANSIKVYRGFLRSLSKC